MRKVIVFRVEDVLVKGYEAEKMYDLKMKRNLIGIVGNEMKEKLGGVKDLNELKDLLVEFEKRFEEEGNVEMFWKMKELLEKFENWEEMRDERVKENRLEFLENRFEKRVLTGREDLLSLERIGNVVKDMRLVFLCGSGKRRVVKLLKNNGLERFEVIGGIDELGEVDGKDVVVFGNERDVEMVREKGMKGVLGMKDVFKEVGLKKGA